eukprot:3890602-Ditylum_brightwellii.AAC.1
MKQRDIVRIYGEAEVFVAKIKLLLTKTRGISCQKVSHQKQSPSLNCWSRAINHLFEAWLPGNQTDP